MIVFEDGSLDFFRSGSMDFIGIQGNAYAGDWLHNFYQQFLFV
jgi:hypothetical protein